MASAVETAADIAARRRMRKSVLGRRPSKRKKLPEQKQPDGLRVRYFRELRVFVRRARELVEKFVVPELEAAFRSGARADGTLVRVAPGVREDAGGGGERIRAAIRKASEAMASSSKKNLELAADLAARYAVSTSELQKNELRKQLRAAVGIDVVKAEPWLAPRIASFVRTNVELITLLPEVYFADIEAKLLEEMRTGTRHELIAEDFRAYYESQLDPLLAERGEIAERRAKLLARDQVGKFFGELNAVRQKNLGIESYVWRTVRDGRVRDVHADRDGKTFEWSDPPGDGSPEDGLHPGSAINCRCSAEPDVSAILAELEDE